MGKNIAVTLGFAVPVLVMSGFAQDAWYELKNLPGANFYEIEKAHEAEKSQKSAEERPDLTQLLAQDPALYEQEEDFRFRRWAEYVEPRVAPSGDLSLLDIGQREMARLAPIDGRELPPMRGAWEPLGPFAQGTAGAGRLNWIDFHPTDNNTYMVGSPGGGLWFTRDAGATWTTTTDKIANLGAAWGVYHPTNPDIIYLGTGDGFGSRDVFSFGLIKSLDGGKTWNSTGLTYDVSRRIQVVKVAIDQKNPNKLLVATSQGLQISTDGGATFKAAAGITGKVWDIEFHPTDASVVYASTTAFYVSSDGGTSFTRLSGAPTASARMMIAVSAAEPDYVYLLRGSQAATQGVSRSTDRGRTFTTTGTGSVIGCAQTWYDYAFDANPKDADELIAGCLRIYRSTNAGETWSQAGSSYHVDIHSTTYRKDGTLFTANDGGVWRSTGATSWANLNNNLNIGQSYRVGVHPLDYDQVCTGRQDNGTDILTASGTWRLSNGGDGFECFWNSTGTRWYGESQNGGFRKCNYSNGTVSNCTSGGPSAAGIWDTPWGPHPTDPAVVYTGRGGNMWKSSNNGSTWSQLGTMGGTGSIRNYAVAASNDGTIYALKGASVYRTSNEGGSWTNVTGTVSGTAMYVAVSATNPQDVWVVVSGYNAANKVYHSTNGGQSWTNETLTGLPNLPANAVVLDNLGQNGVYVGMDAGVYFKRDGMTSWQDFSDGLPNAQIRELEIAKKGSERRLFAATFGRGILRTKLWDEATSHPSHTVRQEVLPALRGLKARVSGSNLVLNFQLGTDQFREGKVEMQVVGLSGKVVYQETIADFGIFERQVDVGAYGKGVYLFVLKNRREKLARPISVH